MAPFEPVDCSPERLMGLVRGGSAEALDQITRCYSDKLLQAGRRHCRTNAEAEDAVQDALLAASESLSGLRDDAALEGWLVRVVASACRRLSRGRKNAAAQHDSDAELTAEGDPEQGAARAELAAKLDRLLLSLDAEDRSLLLLSEVEDFSAAEIGAELGLSGVWRQAQPRGDGRGAAGRLSRRQHAGAPSLSRVEPGCASCGLVSTTQPQKEWPNCPARRLLCRSGMRSKGSFAAVLLASCLAACGGKSFDVDPNQGGSAPGGTNQGGSSSTAGTAQGGSVAQGGNVAKGGTGQGGTGQGGDSTCKSFDDQPASTIEIEIHNQTSAPIHLGQDMVTCDVPPLFAVDDAAGNQLILSESCRSSCQTVRTSGGLGCPAICAYPSALTLQPGEVFYTTWQASFLVPQELPEQCLLEPDYGNTCTQALAIQPGSFTFSAQAGASLDCTQASNGGCQACSPTGSGGCITPAALIDGKRIAATSSVLLDASYGIYGSLPPPLPALPGDAGDAAPGATAYQAVQLVFKD